MMAWAAAGLIPGTSSRVRTAAANGAIPASIRASRAAISPVIASARVSIVPGPNAW
jgi:hypothetical protein